MCQKNCSYLPHDAFAMEPEMTNFHHHLVSEIWAGSRWRHVTTKGQRCDPIIFEAPYLHNGAR